MDLSNKPGLLLLRQIFDEIRLVDKVRQKQAANIGSEDSSHGLVSLKSFHHSATRDNTDHRCTSIECIDDRVYVVTSVAVEVDKKQVVLELVQDITAIR